jgi:hypothetical protein
MKRAPFVLLLAATAVSILVWSTRRVAADDETPDTEIKVSAPLDAVNCAATPPTIFVLGLSIDISAAVIDTGDGGSDDQGGDNQGGDDNGGDDSGGTPTPSVTPSPSGCAALVIGQSVEVKLSSDTPDSNGNLDATEVHQNGEDGEVKIEAPIQTFDATAQTISVLALTIDVSTANLDGADDNSSDGNSQAIDFTQLMMGQFVEMQLASNQPPLSATEVQVLNFTNQVEVEVDDSSGNPVDDSNDDVGVQVTETVKVQANSGGTMHRVKKVLQFHKSANGKFTLSGLPTGRAKITVTRGTSVGKRGVSVKPNTQRTVRLHLRQAG